MGNRGARAASAGGSAPFRFRAFAAYRLLDLLRQNQFFFFFRKAKYFCAKTWLAGTSISRRKAKKMLALCVALFIEK